MHTNLADISAQYIKGVGPDRLKLLKRLGVFTVKDALMYFPRRYEDRSGIKPIADIVPDCFQTVRAKVLHSNTFRTKKGTTIFQLVVSDGTANLYCLWFNQPYMRKYFQPDDIIVLYGRVQKSPKLQVIHPEYELIRDSHGQEDPVHTGRIVPIYPLASGVNQRSLRRIIKNSIEQYASQFDDMLPVDIRARHKLLDIRSAISNIHFPVDEKQKQLARKRIVFDEFFILQLALALRRQKIKCAVSASPHRVDSLKEEEFFNALAFKSTSAQVRVMDEIKKDMQSTKPMYRLVQGEVGSGKTLISAYGLFLTCINNRQGAIMVPTEILANQHYITLNGIFAQLGMKVVLLVNGMKKQEKDNTLESIRTGEADIVVGTHALIQKAIVFRDLGLVVVDEQHKFGVEQRAELKIKNENPDMIVMTATPIPRTMAMTLYGDMDISVIDELPHGKRDVKTMWVDNSHIDKVYDFVKEQLSGGKQAFIIYPVIDLSSSIKSQGAACMYEKLSSTVFKDFRLGLIHGRLDEKQKKSIMSDFKQKRIDLLVSTTIVEVGIDVINASVMVIENAERFGLSQLHQLRGRIGRGKGTSFCILVSDAKTEEARQRLEAISRIQDGFEIAQEDLGIRGPGELFGKQQHGDPMLALGNVISDVDILEDARKEAFNLIANDPALSDPRHEKLKDNLKKKIMDKFHLSMAG
jgi:ATP-dependent DNA helicase RecG